jgi:hypothetical protein
MTDDEPFYALGHRVEPLHPRRHSREPVLAFVVSHDRYVSELADCGEWGIDAMFFNDEEFSHT